jgi:hypothetical protein
MAVNNGQAVDKICNFIFGYPTEKAIPFPLVSSYTANTGIQNFLTTVVQ